MVIIGAIALGLVLGSFLSVLIERWPAWRGVAAGRSHCPHCSHVLAWYDLIPLVSWIFVRGKCRYCKAPISILYPALEIAMASVFGAYAYLFGVPTGWYAVDYLVLFALVALFFFDLKHQMLPDVIIFPLGVVVALRLVSMRPDLLINALATGTLLAAVFGLLYVVSRGRWLGLGDVKLAVVIGLLFGFPATIGVTLIAIWSGGLIGVVLILFRRASPKTALPFGSFWTAAGILAMFVPGPVMFLSGLLTPVLR